MKLSVLAVIVVMLFIAGCASPPQGQTPPTTPPTTTPTKTCRTVVDQIPYTDTRCGDVSYTEPVCGLRKLNYSTILLPEVDICMIDGPCAGSELSECQHCTKAMTRCVMVIKNEEPVQSGQWSVGANYTLGNAMFLKDPITLTIEANHTAAFDFNQIYELGEPANSASCKLFVVKEPTIIDCVQQTKSKYECQNVTMYRNESRQVCE